MKVNIRVGARAQYLPEPEGVRQKIGFGKFSIRLVNKQDPVDTYKRHHLVAVGATAVTVGAIVGVVGCIAMAPFTGGVSLAGVIPFGAVASVSIGLTVKAYRDANAARKALSTVAPQ